MIVSNDRKRGKMASPFRSTGKPVRACLRCPEYRRDGAGARLARFGLRGRCSRELGFCEEVKS